LPEEFFLIFGISGQKISRRGNGEKPEIPPEKIRIQDHQLAPRLDANIDVGGMFAENLFLAVFIREDRARDENQAGKEERMEEKSQ
jgi:hypothetical protein